jgi:hypothetical protein
MASHATIYRDLQTVSEYVTFSDAAKLLNTTTAYLTRVIEGKATLKPSQADYLHKAAVRARRREGQIERIVRADEQRKAKRQIHDTLRSIGHADLKIPDNLPPFLREKVSGVNKGSPVFIYDFSSMSQNDVMQFFNFMKRIMPGGVFAFTYEILPGGVYPSANLRKRYVLREKMIANTHYMEFCVNLPNMRGDSCMVMSNLEFLEVFNQYNDASEYKHVIECAVSYPRPKSTVEHYELTAEELADDLARGADPITGRTVFWSD